MQKMKMYPICKLLLGLCLMLLSNKAMGAPYSYLTIYDRDAFLTQLMSKIDQTYGETLHCPPNVPEEVKKCIRAEANKEMNEVCNVIKTAGNCNKAGLLQCDDGDDLWRTAASNLNRLGEKQGCPKLFEIEKSFFEKNMIWFIIGVVVVSLACKVTTIMVRMHGENKERLVNDPE